MEPENSRHVRLFGEYGIDRRDELRKILESIDLGPVSLDLSGVTYADSIFLGQLVALRRRLQEVTLTGANATLRKIFTLCGFDQLFHIVDE